MSAFGKATKLALMSTTAMTAAAVMNTAIAQDDDEGVFTMEEIMVTATRRSTTLQDVPYNISAVGGDAIERAGITDLGGLSKVIPGLNFNDRGARGQMFSSGMVIRGMNADRLARISAPLQTISPVSTYIGDTPIFVNLMLNDIDRVEVLRGPQGTLYGSGSLGGTIRFIQNKPDLDETSGKVWAGVSKYAGSGDMNWEAGAILNMPISDKVAIRLNAAIRDNAGYIDQPLLYVLDADNRPTLSDPSDFLNSGPVTESKEDTNTGQSMAFRAAVLIEFSESATLNINAYHQENEAGAANTEAYSFYGKGSKLNAHRMEEWFDGQVDMISAELEVDLGFATMSSSTSYSDAHGDGVGDLTGVYDSFPWWSSYYGDNPRALVYSNSATDDRSFTQEARLVSNTDGMIDWVVGAYYQKNKYDGVYEDRFKGGDEWTLACLAAGGLVWTCGGNPLYPAYSEAKGVALSSDLRYLTNFQNDFTDKALFGEVTVHLTEDFQVTGGIRAFDQKFESNTQGGVTLDATSWFWNDPNDPFALFSGNTLEVNDSGVLFKFNTSYDISEDMKVYAVWSEGFRRGGGNALPPIGTDPDLLIYEADTTENREVGIKGSFDRVSYSVAYYNISWDQIQVNRNCSANFILCAVNAGKAKSDGVEVEIHADLTDSFRVDLGYAYTNARITEADTGGVIDGKQLPGAPKSSFNSTIWYMAPVSDDLELTAMLNTAYRGSTTSQIVENLDVAIESYWMWNTSIAVGNDEWTARIYVNNIFDNDGYMSAYNTVNWSERAYALRSKPRTVGMNVSYNF